MSQQQFEVEVTQRNLQEIEFIIQCAQNGPISEYDASLLMAAVGINQKGKDHANS